MDAAVGRWVLRIQRAHLAVFYGAALGNVVRGVPLSASGDFFLPLWTNFLPGKQPGILDWYTILIGVLALAALVVHGSLWVRYKTGDELSARAESFARGGWWLLGTLTLAATAAKFLPSTANPGEFPNLSTEGAMFLAPCHRRISVGMRRRGELAAFLSSLRLSAGDAYQRGLRRVPVRASVDFISRFRADHL